MFLNRKLLSMGSAFAALFLVGCPSRSEPETDRLEPETVVESTSDHSTPSDKRDSVVSPKLDENATNEQGLVVLQGTALEDSDPDGSAAKSALQLSANASPGRPITDVVVDTPARPADAVDGTPEPAASASVSKSDSSLPVEANVATDAERHQKIAENWPQPQAVIFVSGQQHGYLEPCGCTGLDQQKGGLIRRDTLLTELRARGWNLIPVDVGNQVRRVGRQPEIKFQATVEAFKLMDYQAATLGVDDLKLSSVELIQSASSDELNPGAFITANVSIIDPSFFPSHRIVESNGLKIGITAVLEQKYASQIQSDDVEIADPVESLQPVVEKLKEGGCDFLVLLAHASLEESARYARDVPGFDLVVTAGGFGEPTLNPEAIEGSDAVMVQVGTKGMYGGIVGLFDDEDTPVRYQKIAISSQFQDSTRMLERFEQYQTRLKETGFEGLGARPISHPTGRKFVGSEVCGDCHTSAFEKWQETPHMHATDSIVAANNDRGGIERHHDPECVSCHATGWNPQNFYPYETGFLSPESTEHLVGSGCENCHGPGKDHVDAEYGDVEVDNETLLKLQQQMVLKLENAREKCLDCHDLDNSPDFHDEGAFEEYWEAVKHYGKD